MHEKQELQTQNCQVYPINHLPIIHKKSKKILLRWSLPSGASQGCMQYHTLAAPSASGIAVAIAHTSTQSKRSYTYDA